MSDAARLEQTHGAYLQMIACGSTIHSARYPHGGETLRKAGAAGAAIVGGLLVGFGALRNRVARFAIADDSMAPVLFDGDYVIATRPKAPLARGELVVFEHPNRADFHLVKRVIGLPGESVVVANGQVAIDGTILGESWAQGSALGQNTWSLDESHVFVLSDNRTVPTDDSRSFGPIPAGDLWRISYRYWPFRQAQGLRAR